VTGFVVSVDEEGGDVTRTEVADGSSYPGNGARCQVDADRRERAPIAAARRRSGRTSAHQGAVARVGRTVRDLRTGDVAALFIDGDDEPVTCCVQRGGQRQELGGIADVAPVQRHTAETGGDPLVQPAGRLVAREPRQQHCGSRPLETHPFTAPLQAGGDGGAERMKKITRVRCIVDPAISCGNSYPAGLVKNDSTPSPCSPCCSA